MHYKNGRPAKNGDKIVLLSEYPKDANGKSVAAPVSGILYDAVAGNDSCNGRIALVKPTDACPNLKDCLHLDDFLAGMPASFMDISATAKVADELPKSDDETGS